MQNPFGNYDPISATRTYNDVLPSLNVVYDVADNTLLRFAVAKVMARPDYTDVAPRVNLNIGALPVQRAIRISTRIAPAGPISRSSSIRTRTPPTPSASTTRTWKSFITDSLITQNYPVQQQTAPSLQCTTLGPNLFDCPFAINQRTNGGGGSIKGVELSITQPIYGGFGVQTNYTWAEAEADNGDPLPQSSKNQVNLSTYFENPRVSARLSYTYRSKFFVSFDRLTPLNEKALESLDASVSVNLTQNVALTADAVNLTEREDRAVRGRGIQAARDLRQRAHLLRRRAREVLIGRVAPSRRASCGSKGCSWRAYFHADPPTSRSASR